MQKRYEIDMLTQDSVSVKTQNHMIIDGIDYDIGLPNRKAYMNSPLGRESLSAELPEPYLSGVFAVWGDEPTVEDLTN